MNAIHNATLGAALIGLALLCTPVAEAQTASAARAPDTAASFAPDREVGNRLAEALASPAPEVRRSALDAALIYARYNTGRLDLTAMVPALLAIYGEDPDAQCRLAAVVALHAIGDEAGMAAARHRLREQTDRRVRVVTLSALADYHGLGALVGASDLAAVAEALLAPHRDSADGRARPVLARSN
ncbi:MAG: HEAT repeat domain-containing protein [Rhodothermales bacterium]|nr:HEAT repeat domain-containing protein [Rhodothermales bacterium]